MAADPDLTSIRDEETDALEEREPVRSPTRPRLGRVVGGIAIAVALARVLAVDIAGIVTNDSLGYLGRANAPLSHGLVSQGYRQLGYPLFIWLSNLVGDALGWDHIFGVAMLQRTMLVLALGGLIWAAGWWSTPTVVIATSSSYVLLADFVLTEGVIIPCCIASGALLTATTYGRVRASAAPAVLIGSALLALFAGAIKLQFASLLAVTAAIGWTLVRDTLCSRRLATTTIAAALLLVVGLALAQSVENYQSRGTFEPVAERHGPMWWGAWQAVFVLDSANGDDPKLAEFYDGGSPYPFLRSMGADVADYDMRRDATIERTEAMFDAAGTSVWEQRMRSFLGALRGGRSDDLSVGTQRWLGNPPGDALDRISENNLAKSAGTARVIQQLNDGHSPGIVTAGPVLDPAQIVIDDYRSWTRWLAPLAFLLLCVAAIFGRRERPAAIGVLTMYVACAGAMAYGYTDNARYLVGPLTIALIVATNAVRELVIDERARPWRSLRTWGATIGPADGMDESPD